MAIAPLPELETPWPRPALRLAEPLPEECWSASTARRLPGAVAARPRASEAVRRRRRRVLLVLAVIGAVVALALPVSGLGGRPAPAPATPGSSSVLGTGSSVYVVQPGDTLWSIAAKLDAGGNPRPLAEALARETGSSVVVPGERIRVP